MPVLDVPGAVLNYEITGQGPLLMLIPGANGEHHIYHDLAQQMASEYTMLTYDRRGFSQSSLTGVQDYAHRLQTDANDVQRLIFEVGQGQPAVVFGSSSGAIVALQTLLSHPEAVKTVIAHEPPAVKLLSDSEQRLGSYRGMYETYRASGIIAAMEQFVQDVGTVDRMAMGQATNPTRGPFAQANATYWFERELPIYPGTEFNVEALSKLKDRLVLGGGQQSENNIGYQVAAALAERLGLPLAPFAGGHVGYAIHPQEFAADLRAALARK